MGHETRQQQRHFDLVSSFLLDSDVVLNLWFSSSGLLRLTFSVLVT